MNFLIILIVVLSFLLMGAALSECEKSPQKQLKIGVWFGMFPLFLMVSIFSLVNLLVPNPHPFIVEGQNISILFFLFSCLMFGIATKFKSGSGAKWSNQQS